MIYVGIDVASKKHDCYIVSDTNTQSGQLLTIGNDIKGFEALKKRILGDRFKFRVKPPKWCKI